MGLNLFTRGAKILCHAVGLSVHQCDDRAGKGCTGLSNRGRVPEVLTPVERLAKLLFLFAPSLGSRGDTFVQLFVCKFAPSRQWQVRTSDCRPRFTAICLAKSIRRPPRLGKCTDAHILECLNYIGRIHGRSSKVFRCVLCWTYGIPQ